MYIEVVNENAVRRVMKRCQNSYMPGGPLTGGRKRPVTITSVPPHELLNEVSSQADDTGADSSCDPGQLQS